MEADIFEFTPERREIGNNSKYAVITVLHVK